MNQTDAMLFHQQLFRDLYVKAIETEYATALAAVAENSDLTFSISYERAMIVAQDAANAYCLRVGFSVAIPPDDARGKTLIRANVPDQYRGDIPPPTGNFGAGLAPRLFLGVEIASLIERCLKAVVDESGISPEERSTRALIDELRVAFIEEFKRAGFDVPERTKRRKWPWDVAGG